MVLPHSDSPLAIQKHRSNLNEHRCSKINETNSQIDLLKMTGQVHFCCWFKRFFKYFFTKSSFINELNVPAVIKISLTIVAFFR